MTHVNPNDRGEGARSGSSAVRALRSTETIRARCHGLLDLGLAGQLAHFEVRLERLAFAARTTAEVTRRRYPDLNVPVHGRLAHFDAGGSRRTAALFAHLSSLPARARASALCDVVVTSVLLDAGSGELWCYHDQLTNQTLRRSEGLAVASLRWLQSGALSSHGRAYEADARQLVELTDDALAEAFQVRPGNPLLGVAGRAHLLRALGEAVLAQPELFGPDGRVGGLVDRLWAHAVDGQVPASALLQLLLEGLGGIWPGRLAIDGVPLGDVFFHAQAGGSGASAGLVPFHKLSQWLTYSLVEPIGASGLSVANLDALTGLAEYRNGGLFIDAGVLVPRHSDVTARVHPAEAEVIVEWRALTVALLDRLVPLVQRELGVQAEPERMPLASVLEGGTWMAGRELAARAREGGGPPIRIQSDGTVF